MASNINIARKVREYLFRLSTLMKEVGFLLAVKANHLGIIFPTRALTSLALVIPFLLGRCDKS
jgi:hypothetical protein